MERDWFDWASLIFNMTATSAGLIGLFVAVRAYKVAKAQHRTSFDLRILEELEEILFNPKFRDEFSRIYDAHLGDDHSIDIGPVRRLFDSYGVNYRLDRFSQNRRRGLKLWNYFTHAKLHRFIIESPAEGTYLRYSENRSYWALFRLSTELEKARLSCLD
ncbi:hypothetical protein ACQPZK_07535 [Micromonospora sp. CA-249363]|uniref:hypothetical protein n=1 Tax=Micromonospora sp. CA-249363 TaxID=3239963 RepID=UPI003D8A480A